ncbi:MAG: DNA methylase [Clostridia bacterium]|nr:DNA methylase [Clostridia bacterium]
MERQYIAIDMKSFYASVECVARRLNPLTTRLLVADPSRSDQTICLAVSPALKEIGVPGRPRLFEAKQAIAAYEQAHHTRVSYITAVPRMALYERVSARIFGILLRYAAPEDIHVYSIDESFIDCTPYQSLYQEEAERQGQSYAHVMAMTIIRDVLRATGITATVGIGTNLYLAKVAMDIVAKKKPADANGVRIASLDEDLYKILLWDHQPLTDFWMLGPGKARTLRSAFLWTMGDVAVKAQSDEEWFYRKFGIDGEILIDHAFGIEPVTMADIKHYQPDARSLSNGQVLPRPYPYGEARNVLREMIDVLCSDLLSRRLHASVFSWWVSYDYRSLEKVPGYDGPVILDFYGRLHPKHSNGTVRLRLKTSSPQLIADALLASFDQKTDHRLLFRRLGVCASDVLLDSGVYQLDFFTDFEALERERKLRSALLGVRGRFGLNAVFKGNSLLEGANQLERNLQIGGHRA